MEMIKQKAGQNQMGKKEPTIIGKFIVIEGIDGAGTTTQARMLFEWILSRGRRAVMTCEPSRGPVGLLLHQILSGRTVVRLLDGSSRPLNNDVISLLFAADRMDHLDNEILPALESGLNVVCDRYYHSSFTYQSLQGDLNWIRTLNVSAKAPDVTYLLDLPAQQAAIRRQRTRATEELYEKPDVQEKLRESYRQLPTLLAKETIMVLDGRPDTQTVHRTITEDLIRRFGWD